MASEEELNGKTDFDLFPPRLAEHFRREDRLVFETKKPRLNILELFFNKQGLPGWCLDKQISHVRYRMVMWLVSMGTVSPHDDGELEVGARGRYWQSGWSHSPKLS